MNQKHLQIKYHCARGNKEHSRSDDHIERQRPELGVLQGPHELLSSCSPVMRGKGADVRTKYCQQSTL